MWRRRPKLRVLGVLGGTLLAFAWLAHRAAPLAQAAPELKGIALGLYGDGQGSDFSRMLGEIADLGADHVSLVVSWRQHDVRSDLLAPTAGTTLPDDQVREVIRAARKARLKVFLFPIIEVEIRRPLEWRGTIHPGDVDAWWQGYEKFILHYAAIAGEEKADLFAVGSELVSTETWQERWYHLISAVKKLYRGKLLYSANWDHYEQVSFWERVDYVGVTAYNELTKKSDASEAELASAWKDVREKLVAFARKVNRPLIITEIGYTSQDGAAVHPWDYTLRSKLDLEEQRRCYAAFVAAWKDEPALAGVFWWNWWGAGGPTDTSYTPRGKPAEDVLRSWYGKSRRP
jgi:glycosyl hydrolase family 113